MRTKLLIALGLLLVAIGPALIAMSDPRSAQEVQASNALWEYKVEQIAMDEKRDVDSELKLFEKQLNDRANEGWELCQIQLKTLIFKRAK